ncbi:MAG: phosphomannomutase/phosphoglucomutase [Candidatus Eisenbacteria bacterium]|uniref:Phosphomannomutase/phosphoglucomutase n=1 Tax=Eiseniibacteriota bacterium TaxID=2212470 RepID=A0A937XA87_UNCEI|nr:phosphomannomutase/phosphoglucomutase [Candidatus Eisenbacteria bacterium]
MNPAIFREYDIRGVADRDLTDELAEQVGRAVASRLRREGVKALCLGRDVRASSPRLRAGVAAGIRAAGLDVLDVGVVPTPVLYYSIVASGAGGGIMITGSHNPIAYNGFKITRGTSPIWGAEIRDLALQMERGDFESGAGGLACADMLPRYRAMIAERLPRERPLRIVVDAGNGTGGRIGPEVLEEMGHEVVRLYCDPDGSFPHHLPDPTVPAYMVDLQARVLAERADLGVGFDGDADRIGLVDERGRLIFGDQILALYARELLERRPGSTILFDVKCSQGLEEDILAHGGVPVMWKTGHSLLKAKMKEDDIPLAGEMSGHMFFADGYFGFDDAIYGAARMAAYLGRLPEPLSAQIDRIPAYVNSPEIRVPCPDERKFAVVEAVAEHFRAGHRVIDIDGARVVFPDGWGLLRASNTQPVLVLRFESRSQAGMEGIERRFRQALAGFPEVVWAP